MPIFPPLLYPVTLYILSILGASVSKRRWSVLYLMFTLLSIALAIGAIIVHGRLVLQTMGDTGTLSLIIEDVAK